MLLNSIDMRGRMNDAIHNNSTDPVEWKYLEFEKLETLELMKTTGKNHFITYVKF